MEWVPSSSRLLRMAGLMRPVSPHTLQNPKLLLGHCGLIVICQWCLLRLFPWIWHFMRCICGIQGRERKLLPLVFCLSCRWLQPVQCCPCRLFMLCLSQRSAQIVTAAELDPDFGAISNECHRKGALLCSAPLVPLTERTMVNISLLMQTEWSLLLSLLWSVSHQIKFCLGKSQKPAGSFG